MRQIKFKILLSILLLIPNLQGFAATPSQNLDLIENQILGYTNSNLNETERLNKLENFIYGSTQKTSNSNRLKKLNTDLGIEPDGPKIKAEKTYEEYANEPNDPSAQYPVVDKIETALLNQTYPTENIYKRLDRLEQKAYGKTSKNSLNERVEKLSGLITPTDYSTGESFDEYMANNYEYNYYSPTTNGNPHASQPQTQYDNYTTGLQTPNDTNSALLALEKSIFGKTYQNDGKYERLSRLEKKMLHKEFSTEPDRLRLERLTTIASAQQSSKVYKDNRLMQHLATGVQIGGMLLMLLAMIL